MVELLVKFNGVYLYRYVEKSTIYNIFFYKKVVSFRNEGDINPPFGHLRYINPVSIRWWKQSMICLFRMHLNRFSDNFWCVMGIVVFQIVYILWVMQGDAKRARVEQCYGSLLMRVFYFHELPVFEMNLNWQVYILSALARTQKKKRMYLILIMWIYIFITGLLL
jgi:hypothetical protein